MSQSAQNDLPGFEAVPMGDLNTARFAAFKHCAEAVELLAKTMNDPEVDLDQRCICAAELLQFVAKGF